MIQQYCPKCRSTMNQRYDYIFDEVFICQSCRLEFVISTVMVEDNNCEEYNISREGHSIPYDK